VEQVRSRRILIMEDNPDGHRLSYVSLLASAAAAAGYHVTLATTEEVLSSNEWSIHMGKAWSVMEYQILDYYSIAALSRLSNELDVDHVVIPDGDSFAYELSKGHRWTGRGTVSVLVMREKGQMSRIPGLALVKTVVKGLLLQFANFRPRVQIRVLKSATWRGYSTLPVSRDPVNLSCADQRSESANLPILLDNYFWFGVVGRVGQRKNLPLVAAAVAALDRGDVALLVAGQIDEGILQEAKPHLDLIREAGGRIEVVDRLLSDLEMDQIITELDCVVLAHSNDGPSGILGKAVAAGTKIVAAGASTLRADCRHIGASAEWVQMTEQRLSTALARAISKPAPQAGQLASPVEFTSGLLGNKP
jgi:glycosyltransferase involved in cell wall biosynthesis